MLWYYNFFLRILRIAGVGGAVPCPTKTVRANCIIIVTNAGGIPQSGIPSRAGKLQKGPEHRAGYNREIEPSGQRYREMLIAVF
jgi:hypothetical protein